MKKLFWLKNYQTGMTLLEILVVVFILGILSTIMAPNWFNFINQQKLNKVNENLELSIREGQHKAKRENVSYTVEFQLNNDNALEYKTYAGLPPDTNSKSWQSILDQPENMTISLAEGNKITFNHDGTINSGSELKTNEKIVVSLLDFNPQSQRCVIVKTLLGSITTGKNTECQ